MMNLVQPHSLAATVDQVNAAHFFSEQLTPTGRAAAARFIAARQGQPGGYRGLFAALDSEPGNTLTLFTGEKISHASARHVLGQEAYRALLLLGVATPEIHAALVAAPQAVAKLLAEPDRRGPGMYCCGKCSVSVWRAILAGGYGGDRGFIEAGVKTLGRHRDGQGRWRVFPFWYTALALIELASKAARAELRYTAPVLERAIRRRAADETYALRRRTIAERALAQL